MPNAVLSNKQSKLVGFMLLCLMMLAMLTAAVSHRAILGLVSPDLAFMLVFAVCIIAGIKLFLFSRMNIAFANELVIIGVPLAMPVFIFVLMLAMSPSLAAIIPVVLEKGMMPLLALLSILPTSAIVIAFLVNRIVYYRKDNVPEGRRSAALVITYTALAVFALSLLGEAFIVGANSMDMLEAAIGASLLFLIFPFALNLFIIGDLLISFNPSYSGMVILFLPVGYLLFALLGAILGAVSFLLFG
ncbi:MAG: hypothetical protein ABII71_04560 [Candidatus Micrarchaeota archaeon]